MESQPLSEDETKLISRVFGSTLSHTLHHIILSEVTRYKEEHKAELIHMEPHTSSEQIDFRGTCVAHIRLVLCKFSNGGVLGVKLQMDYIHLGSYSL